MRNNCFYILIFCAFTISIAKDEEEKSPAKEMVKHTREYYEEEAKKDLEALLSSLRHRNFREEEEEDAEPMNINEPTSRLMERIDEVVNEPQTKNDRNRLRSVNRITADNYKRAQMRHLPTNLRNNMKSSFNPIHNTYVNKQPFQQLVNRFSSANGFLKNRITGGKSVNSLLRNHVNQVNIKPEVYPLPTPENNYFAKEITSADNNNNQLRHQFYSKENEFANIMNSINTKRKNQSVTRTASIPMSDNYDLNEPFNQFRSTDGRVYPTRKESGNDIFLNDLLNKLYTKSTNHLRNKLENNFDKLQDVLDLKNRDGTNSMFVRNDYIDKDNSDTNESLNEFMKYLEIGQNLKTAHNTLSHSKISQPVFLRQTKRGYRNRRSTNTQAGYTQDPDTCKTYNENLVKLWSNLSKLINVTEQPNEKALHNIAMMIQAYLEHQNAKQLPETHKMKHEGPRDKISEVMLRIRKLLDDSDGSAEKITKIIIKYLKPDYADVQSEDCQEVNEETLGLSVDLLYKNYLENSVECNSEDDGMARNNKMTLRKRKSKSGKGLNNNAHNSIPLATHDYKPAIQTILIENELYNDYHKGTFARQKRIDKNRRVMRSRKYRPRPAIYRSGNRNENDKQKIQSKASRKSAIKKLKKNSLKSHLVPGSCEKYATRKLIVSLRPVMERFMGLLECQLDNTLRSVDFDRVSKNPYYLYASKFYSNDDNRRHRKVLPRLLKHTGRKISKSHKIIHAKRHDDSVENEQDGLVHNDDTDSAWVRKYSFDQTKGMNSASPTLTRDSDARESDTESTKQQQHGNHDYISTYNEYFQSPPLYDDYDGIYKTHKVTNLNGFPSLINPLMSLNDKKVTKERSTNMKLTSSDKERDTENEKSNEYDTYYDNSSEEPAETSNVEQQTETNLVIEEPFIDFTKLRSDDHLIEEKGKTHVQSFESITEFLKKARDASLQTPEFALPFALDTNKGYVELTHLIKYPKVLVYRPQFLVKNTMPYDDFLKTINNINMTNDEVRLMKIVRHLPDSSVQVLFETEDSEAPLEVRNLNDNRRSGSPDPVGGYQFESRIETSIKNKKAELTHGDGKHFDPIYRNEAHRQNGDALVNLDSIYSDDYVSPDIDLNRALEILIKANEELSPNLHFDFNSDTNVTSNSKPNSSESGSNSGFTSGLVAKNPNFESRIAVGPELGSGMSTGLDTALNLGVKLSPLQPSQLSSFFSKLFPSSFANSNPSLSSESSTTSYTVSSSSTLSTSSTLSPSNSYSQLNSHADSLSTNSGSHSLVPYTESSNTEVGNSIPSPAPSILLRWWRKWKNAIKAKIKQIIRKMASLKNNIDQVVKV